MIFIITLLSLVQVVKSITFKNNHYYSTICSNENKDNIVQQQLKCSIVEGKSNHPNSHAYAIFRDEVEKDGWGKLWVTGDDTIEGWFQSGFLEGALTSERIYQHVLSWYNYQFKPTSYPSQNLINFLLEQYTYSQELVKANPNDEYYIRLHEVNTQFEGVHAGQNFAAKPGQNMSFVDILTLQAAGDVYDIVPALDPSAFKLQVGSLSLEEFDSEWHKMISCSALVKMADDRRDVFVGHTTWTSYQNMLRVYKHYNLAGGKYQSSFSAKPGSIYSKDDFYVLPRDDQQLVVMETTNGIMNASLYQLITPKSLLTWQRVPIANSLSLSSKQWTAIFAVHNSGTYANMWIIADMKLFTPLKGVSKDFLWIIEVAPGIASSMDVTSVFQSQGSYFASYNVPYQQDVYIESGFQQAYDTYGDIYSYTNCPRALIFARNHTTIQTFEDVQNMMRYNEYQIDPLSQGKSNYAISSRYDLTSTGSGSSFGGTDSKVTSYSRIMTPLGVKEGLVSAQCGPTHDNQKPFQWSNTVFDKSQVHLGQPDVFNFTFVNIYSTPFQE